MATVTTTEQGTQTDFILKHQGTQTAETVENITPQLDTTGHPTTSSMLDIGEELTCLVDRLQKEVPSGETTDFDWLREEGF